MSFFIYSENQNFCGCLCFAVPLKENFEHVKCFESCSRLLHKSKGSFVQC